MESRWRWVIWLLLAIVGVGVAQWQGWIELLGTLLRVIISKQVPAWTLAVTLLALVAIIVIARARELRLRRSPGIFWIGGGWPGQYVDHGTGTYDGVLWRLRLPDFRHAMQMPEPSQVAASLRIGGPFCPKCETELEERERFLRGYDWTCPRGDFTQKRRVSMDDTRKRALLIFRREVEKQAQAELQQRRDFPS